MTYKLLRERGPCFVNLHPVDRRGTGLTSTEDLQHCTYSDDDKVAYCVP